MRRWQRIATSTTMIGVALAMPVDKHPDTLLQFLAACLRGGLWVPAGVIVGPVISELWQEARDRWAMHMRWRRTRRNARLGKGYGGPPPPAHINCRCTLRPTTTGDDDAG